MARLKIAAVGSSFAAGPGIEPIIDPATMRSGRNYAHQLASKLDAELTDLTVSGATLLNVLNEPQETRSGVTVPPQLESLPSDADIVTLTAGGNDLGYVLGMMYDSAMAYAGPLQHLLRRWSTHPTMPVTFDQLVDRFVAVIDAIHQRAPKARIYLVEYLSIFGEGSRPGHGVPSLTWGEIEHYRRRGVLLDRAYAKAVEARAEVAELVPAGRMSEGHEVGTAEPWMEGFNLMMLWRGKIPFHPNLAGHTAVAEELYRRISGG